MQEAPQLIASCGASFFAVSRGVDKVASCLYSYIQKQGTPNKENTMGKRSAVIESAVIFVDEIKTGTTFTVQNTGFDTQSEAMVAMSDIQADALDSNGGFKVLVTAAGQAEEFWRLIGANDTVRAN